MAFQYLTNAALSEARNEYLKKLTELGYRAAEERIPSEKAEGRVTSKAIYARISAPHYPASAMDGIALEARCTYGATETTPVTLSKAQFEVVDTGDPVPEQYDAVVMIEDVVWLEDGGVRLYSAAAPWQHIRQIGEDICAGEMIMPSYSRITPASIGALLAGGVLEVDVLSIPVVGIIPTGDEIVPPTSDPGRGDILEFNSSIFSAMIHEWGAQSITYPIVPDNKEVIRDALSEALGACDIVLLLAGSSAGREDYSSQVIEELGHVMYHGLAIKPGKPAILGYQDRKAVIGVPGYPVSGIIVLNQLLKPLIDAWFYRAADKAETARGILTKTIVSGLKYQEFVRVRMGRVGDRMTVSPLSRGSGIITSFMKADGILEIPQGCEGYEAGTEVTVNLLRPADALDHTLVAIGSHDPLLDELADLMHRENRDLYMSSSHVGSMGGIMAVRRGETHIAGIHLLDEKDGTYNTSFVKKYFPGGGVRLVECVGRTQGLMLQKGNPLKIKAIKDLAGPGMRYVNRQKGSGTRILIDYLCKKDGIDTKNIYGYDREEFTHNAVAVQIASGTADAGMGIYSAAKLYDLDFLPICMEQYDLLVPDAAWDSDVVQKLISILQGPEFRMRLEALGGYEVNHPGTVRERF